MPIDQLTRFYRGVHPRVEWNEDKTGINKLHHSEEESWIALFIDLVYVAMFINVGHILEDCGSNKETVISSFVIFLVMFISRYSIDEYSNRFFADDVFHRLVYFVYTFGVFVMTMNISSKIAEEDGGDHRMLVHSKSDLGNCEISSDYSQGFLAGLIVTRLSLMILYCMVCYYDKKGLDQFGVSIFRHAFSLLAIVFVMFAGVSFSGALTIIGVVDALWAVGIPAIVRIPGIGLHCISYTYHYPLDIYEVQSRLGIFVMMVLGESMIQLLTSSYNTNHSNEAYLFQGYAIHELQVVFDVSNI